MKKFILNMMLLSGITATAAAQAYDPVPMAVTPATQLENNALLNNPIQNVATEMYRSYWVWDKTSTSWVKRVERLSPNTAVINADPRYKISYTGDNIGSNAGKGLDIISIAPNPVVTDNFKLNVSSALASKMDISIVDMQGSIVNRQSVFVTAGFNSITVNVRNLAPGTYTILGSIPNDKSKLIQFIKQ